MIDQFHHRLRKVEDSLSRRISTPTFPIYDGSLYPQDSRIGQIALKTDGAISWYDGSWHTKNGTITAGGPHDALDGQVVIGSDNSLCWRVNGVWYSLAGELSIGGPQDPLEGQVAVSSNDSGSNICWFSNNNWYCSQAPV